MGLMLWWKVFNNEDVVLLKKLIEAEKISPVIDRRYPLADVPAALRYLQEGHARGKVVITIRRSVSPVDGVTAIGGLTGQRHPPAAALPQHAQPRLPTASACRPRR